MRQYRKPLPHPKWLLKLTVLLSLGVHGFLLWSPLPNRDRATVSVPESTPADAIKIIALDSLGLGATTQPRGGKMTSPAASLATENLATENLAIATIPNTSNTTSQPNGTGTPLNSGTGGKDPNSGGATITDPFANFPQYPNAVTGSAGFFILPHADRGAKNTTDAIAQVTNFFQTEALKQGFNPLKSWANGSFFQVYEVAIANVEPRYLHLIQHDGRTVIALLDQPVSEAELKHQQKIAMASPTERTFEQIFADVYAQLPLEDLELNAQVRQKLPIAIQDKNLLARGKYNSEFVITAITQALNAQEFMSLPTGTDAYLVQHRQDSFLKSLYIVRLDDGAIGLITAEN